MSTLDEAAAELGRQARRGADHLAVAVRGVGDDQVSQLEGWVLYADHVYGETFDLDAVVGRVIRIGWPEGGEPRYGLDVREGHVEWGASGGSTQVILDTARDLFTAAAWQLLLEAGRYIWRATRSGDLALDEDEVVRRARWAICLGHQDLTWADLAVRGVSLGAGSGSATLRHEPSSRTFSVDVTLIGGEVTASRVSWTAD